jgi:hypothetical protein
MNIQLLLALALPILIGILILQLLLPHHLYLRTRVGNLWRLFLAPGTGFALVSCILFLWISFFNPELANTGLLFIESILVIILAITLYFSKKKTNKNEPAYRKKKLSPFHLVSFLATIVLMILFLFFLEAWQRESFMTPFGEWDAWAIWNLRAGFLASGSEWLQGFSDEIAWSHLDYPLLLPLNVARLWIIQAERSVLAPILLGLIYQISLVGLLIASVICFRGYLQGIIAGIIGLVVLFVSLNFKLYADIPIAYYFLAANALLFFANVSSTKKNSYLILAGFLTGAALWTKNEGWAFLVSIAIAKMLLDLIYRNNLSKSLKWWGYFLIGLAPLLLVTVYFKMAYAPPGDILSGLDLITIKAKLLNVSRYLVIIRSTRNQIFNYGNLIVPLLPLLVIYGFIVGISFPKSQARDILFLTLRVLLLVMIYFFVYLFTPNDLNWHLNTSIERLATQTMPSTLLLYFLVVSTINNKDGDPEPTFSLDWSRLRFRSG